MKKICRFILTGLCCALVFSYTGQAAVKDGTLITDEPGGYSVPALSLPHADMEVYGLHNAAVSQVNQGFKKGSGDGNDQDWKTTTLHYHPFTGCEFVLNYIYCKIYLTFIYPSHNFW